LTHILHAEVPSMTTV